MRNTDSYTIQELADIAADANQQAGEMRAEHLGECARFGDSWPNAAAHVAAAEAESDYWQARLNARIARFIGPDPLMDAEMALILSLRPKPPVYDNTGVPF